MSLKGRLKKGISTRLLLWMPFALLPMTEASADTLMEALSKAYQGNPNLAAQQANLRSVDENLSQAYAQRRPTITGQAIGGVQPQSTNFRGGSTTGTGQSDGGVLPQSTNKTHYSTLYPYSASIDLTQPLWTGGRADASINQANYQIKAGRANLLNEEETILLQAATAYFDVYNN